MTAAVVLQQELSERGEDTPGRRGLLVDEVGDAGEEGAEVLDMDTT